MHLNDKKLLFVISSDLESLKLKLNGVSMIFQQHRRQDGIYFHWNGDNGFDFTPQFFLSDCFVKTNILFRYHCLSLVVFPFLLNGRVRCP